jgi:hypothetical protein
MSAVTEMSDALDPIESFAAYLESNPDASMMLLQPPIAVNAAYIDIAGGLTGGVLLSALCQVDADSDNEFAAIPKSDWQPYSTAAIHGIYRLTDKEQRTARERLSRLKLIEERRTGYPAQLQIKVNHQAIGHALMTLLKNKASLAGGQGQKSPALH